MSRPSSLYRWAQLVRFPNTFTILADVTAGYVLVAHSGSPIGRLLCVVAAGVLLYWAGMVLNDWFDVEKDRVERPHRPLPAGHLSLAVAGRAGWFLLAAGVGAAGLSGAIPATDYVWNLRPAIVGLVLAVMIVAYDGPLKQTIIAPVVMGLCRFLSFLLGAVTAMPAALEFAGIGTGSENDFAAPHVLAFAAGMGLYITGVTCMARHEAKAQQKSAVLPIGLIIAMLGALVLAFAPRLAAPGEIWHLSPSRSFPMLIGLIALAVFVRGIRAISDPSPAKIQILIKISILTLIPFCAAIALLGAGPAWGGGLFALVVPAILLSARFRVT
ncbi:prenyltransferase [Roseimaritima multifibrata]|uniref:Prenyltransferase n=1 Tax=Roseimaritima multifibrata TaxID=1930274 RepID=A0A517M8W2_9BACT|nr:UbiA family prenyltransferase [Roseimaritima multifibrata]QDS91304.1 prenyltransferase [Roseimaritima multifibrata]